MAEIKITYAAARVNAEMTQKEACKALGVSQSTLIDWEKYNRSPGKAYLLLMSDVYRLPVENFLTENNN